MDGVTAATMRFEGAAPRRAARYGVLSLVLATLLGQGKAGAGGDCRVPRRLRERGEGGEGGARSGSHFEPLATETADTDLSLEHLNRG